MSVVVTMAAAACSSPQGVGVASLGATTTTAAAPGGGAVASNAQNYADALKFASCMRAHAIPNWPDPDSDGNFIISGPMLHVSAAVQNRAQLACQHLLPNNGEPTAAEQKQFLARALKLSACMRGHGEPDFPDPVVRNGGISMRLGGAGVDPNSPAYARATAACRNLFPGGVPPIRPGKGGAVAIHKVGS